MPFDADFLDGDNIYATCSSAPPWGSSKSIVQELRELQDKFEAMRIKQQSIVMTDAVFEEMKSVIPTVGARSEIDTFSGIEVYHRETSEECLALCRYLRSQGIEVTLIDNGMF